MLLLLLILSGGAACILSFLPHLPDATCVASVAVATADDDEDAADIYCCY
jgi:hypothetical protein